MKKKQKKKKQAKKEKTPPSQHRRDFDKLLDDAIFGVKKGPRG